MYLLIFVLWLIFNARITPEIIIFGLLIVIGSAYFSQKFLHYHIKRELTLYRNIPFFIVYFLNLVLEIIKASLLVIRDALHPGRRPMPYVVEFHSGLHDDLANVMLANSITLTPGTYTLFQQGDHFVVHCLMKEYAAGIDDSSFIRLLRRMKQEEN